MACFFNPQLCTLYLLLIYFTSITTTAASTSTSLHPKALLLSVSKDSSTNQYTTKLIQRTPPVSVSLTLDLGTQFLWVSCGKRYISSTYRPVYYGSPLCALANANTCKTCPASPKPGCNKNTCRTLSIRNPITNKSPPSGSELATDVIRINSTDGASPGQLVSVPNFLFVCAPTSLLGGLAKGVSGVAGLGRTKASIPTQFSSTFRFPQIFALCLPVDSQFNGDGVVFLGDGPYTFSPAGTGTTVDLRTKLSYTPLLINPVRSSEYFIGVRGINIVGEAVKINKNLLSIDSKGYGGTTISLLHPYTVMETSIFKAVTTLFDNILTNGTSFSAKRVAPVEPFELCYDPSTLPFTRIGPVVPDIDLVLQSQDVVWTLAAPNLVVRANMSNAYCLGIVDGGKNPKSSIIIGGYQIEDNLLQFDLAKSRLGFSSALIYDRIGCSNFNVL